MEENQIEKSEEVINNNSQKADQKQIVAAIIVAGMLIAGAILLKDSEAPVEQVATGPQPEKVTSVDRSIGNDRAKLTIIMYEGFQCPLCGRFHNDAGKQIRNTYVANGDVRFVYRDFAFLGPESVRAAEASWCANDQGKFWEYHDYLYEHQIGETGGAFADQNLKNFAQNIGLNTEAFNSCLDSEKYAQTVTRAKEEGVRAGVTGTPKGFILKKDKVVETIDGAEPFSAVKTKIDNALNN